MRSLLALMSKGRADGGTRAPGDDNTVEQNLNDDAGSVGFDSAADDCFDALKANDQDGFREALQSAIQMVR